MDDPTDAYEPLTEIEVAENLDVSDIDLTLVKGWVHQMADHELMVKLRKDILGDLCIRFCDEAESQATNQQFRKKDKPTNVLSFPADLYVPDIHLLGDLLICIPVVRAEAAAQGKSVQNHLHHLIIHGVLHLLGYDHEVELEAQRMEAVEVALLAAAGVPDPYFLAPHHTSD